MRFEAAIQLWCTPGSRIIDLGAGVGRSAIFLAQQGYRVHAIDASPRAIATLRARSVESGVSITTEVLDACSPRIDFRLYHAVLCSCVLHLLTRDRANELLDRARTSAEPGTIHAITAITTHGDF